MQTYICVVRVINVSVKNFIKMKALKQLFLNFGYGNTKLTNTFFEKNLKFLELSENGKQ